ncbi:MAG TPA: CPBP family intramembrane glutamic endopeptidase [Chthoniobacterales bacterium]|nr:CPBP family intramembrane glutamic endopeptidase [Chthoniobacterales bacterium]
MALRQNLTLAGLKDAARLFIYLGASILLGALLAPLLFWSAQACAPQLFARVDFESFFHRALLIALAALLFPFTRWVRGRRWQDLQLEPNRQWSRDVAAGFLLALAPLLCCGALLVVAHLFSLRHVVNWSGLAKVIGAAVAVPLIEESFFRGLVLGILLRSGHKYIAMVLSSALFSIVHFFKAPEQTSPIVTWSSGFDSIAHSFSKFANPTVVAAGFTTLFLIGYIMADARVKTRSLWLPIGLHCGWIFGSGLFNRIAHREVIALPWVGKNLLVGIVPLAVAALTWLLMRRWLRSRACD